MSRTQLMMAAAAFALAVCGGAVAQPTDQPAPLPAGDQMGAPAGAPAPGAPAEAMQAPSADAAAANTSAQVVSPGDAPPAQVDALAQGDNRTVTNGPVPDTSANRAKFGGPMSTTGKKTRPAGN